MNDTNVKNDYSEYTVKTSTEPSFYGSECTQADADCIAKNISDLIRSEFPGITVEDMDGRKREQQNHWTGRERC